jgi:hypothetical protein
MYFFIVFIELTIIGLNLTSALMLSAFNAPQILHFGGEIFLKNCSFALFNNALKLKRTA